MYSSRVGSFSNDTFYRVNVSIFTGLKESPVLIAFSHLARNNYVDDTIVPTPEGAKQPEGCNVKAGISLAVEAIHIKGKTVTLNAILYRTTAKTTVLLLSQALGQRSAYIEDPGSPICWVLTHPVYIPYFVQVL